MFFSKPNRGLNRYYLLATSTFSAKVLSEAFDVPKNRMIISGYPRNYEPITDKPIKYVTQKEIKYLKKIQRAKSERYTIIGYFPTFRDKIETNLFGIQNIKELEELLSFFKENKIKLICKFHFAEKQGDFIDILKNESLINLPSDIDVYNFLSMIDILITDYSSIYFDFLLWEKPIIFFPYDLTYYCNEDRGLIFDYEEFTPGPKVYSTKELIELFSKGINEFNRLYFTNYSQKALNLRKKIFANFQDMKIEHLIKQIMKI